MNRERLIEVLWASVGSVVVCVGEEEAFEECGRMCVGVCCECRRREHVVGSARWAWIGVKGGACGLVCRHGW